MLRKFLYIGIFTGTSAAIPIAYEANPESFMRLLDSVIHNEETHEVAVAPATAPAKPTVAAQPEQLLGRKVRVEADPRGHFTGEFKLNGRRVDAMIDTGATLVAINLSTAKKIGIKLEAEDFRFKVNTANGETRAAAATIDKLQIGKIFVENVEAVVLDDSALSSALIGMSFLKQLSKYQVENGSLLLVQ